MPDKLSLATLLEAAKRGVAVRIIVPGTRTDQLVVRRASRTLWGPLLKAGVEIYEYRPTMYHCKVMVVDGIWTSVGSTNFDSRSFRLNDEANLNVYDADFAAEETRNFESDVRRSEQVTWKRWKRRPWTEKLIERFALLFRSQI
ncbi:MAG: phospholipase D-like domain-containing protein [Pirellulales bacterium]